MSIFHDGVLCDVHVSYWSGAKHLTAEDLGLTQEEVSKAFKLGTKELIPDTVMHAFRLIESRARQAVITNSFPFPIGHAQFLPKSRAEKVFTELEAYKAEYDQLVEDLIANYQTYKDTMRPIYREAAETAFINQVPAGVSEFSIEGREADKDRYVQNFLARIEAHYPAAETLRSRFSLTWDVYTISLDAEKTTESHLLHQAAREEAQQTLNLQTQVKHQLDIEGYKEQTTQRIGGFVNEVVTTLRQQTMKLCDTIAQNIKDGMVITGRTTNRLKEYIDKFQDMNFVGDSVVEEQLQTFKKEFLDIFPTDQLREDPELQEELGRRLTLISKAAAETVDVSDITGQYTRRVMWGNRAAA